MAEHGDGYWIPAGGEPCDVCGEWTRRRCDCGQAVCTDCKEQPHTEGTQP